MSKTYRSQLGRLVFVIVLVGTLMGVGTSAFAAVKQFSLVLTPSTAGAGTVPTYSGLITNESGGTLDSVTITIPSSASAPGFKILSAIGGTVSQVGDSATWTGLGLNGSGSSTTVSFTAGVTCGTGSFSWGATGKASNNQSFVLDSGASNVATTLTGTCNLAMSNVGNAQKSTVISTVNYTSPSDPSNPAPVTAQLLDAGNNLMTWVSGPSVDLTLAPNPTALQGGSANLSSGVASFTSLKVSQANLSYTLTPSLGTSVSGAASNAFQIWDKDQKCKANQSCPATFAVDLITTTNATFTTDTGILIGYNVQTSPCPADTYNHLGQEIGGNLEPAVVSVQTEGQEQPTGPWVTTFKVSKAADQDQPQNGVSNYQLCLMTKVQFTTLDGTLATPCDGTVCPEGFFYGLMQNAPHCDGDACILTKTKSKSGVVTIVVRLPADDPLHH